MRLGSLVLVAAAGIVVPASAVMHATLVSSEPAANSRLATSPSRVRLVYSEPVEGRLAKVTIRAGSGTPIVLRAGGDPRDVHAVIAAVDSLGAGSYRVDWRVVSADGHPVDGTFTFAVGDTTLGTAAADPADPGPVQPDPAQPEAEVWGPAVFGAPLIPALLRGAALGALMMTAGLLVFVAGAGPGTPQRGDRRVRRAITACAIAAPVLLGAHLITWLINTSPDLRFDLSWSASALGTTVGRVELWREGLTILALWAWWLARRARLALAFAAGALVVSGAVGHSAAMHPEWAVPAKAIHLLAGSVWLGGLARLVIRPTADDVVLFASDAARVSSRALVAVIAVAFTGIVQTGLFLPAWGDLMTSAYGWLALTKVGGLLALAAFGAYHRQRVMPRLAAAARTTADVAVLRKSVAREMVVFALVIVVGGLLAYVPPPEAMEPGMHPAASSP